MEFKSGDLVVLKSGGPLLVVSDVVPENRTLRVVYTAKDDVLREIGVAMECVSPAFKASFPAPLDGSRER